MADSYNVDEVAKAINDLMQEFAGAVDYDIWYVVEKVAKKARENVVNAIKASGIRDKTYSKSIAIRDLKSKRLMKKKLLYSKAPHYRLTHLLEYGHAKTSGGRTRAFMHWKPAEQKAIDDFMRELKERIES